MINKAYKFLLPLMGLWLVAWIILSWAATQDDALIHLRYADNLYRTHFITYDGVHPSYGTSSLLYVYLLAFLRAFITSPGLPRALSSFMHLLFVGITGIILVKFIPRTSLRTRLLSLIMLFILVTPSAVRWLDDGMETGFALCFVALLCILTFQQSRRPTTTPLQYFTFTALAFFTVLLRTELSFLCGVAFAMLVWKSALSTAQPARSRWLRAILRSSHLMLGSLLALSYITLKMHSLLPDTALAKSGAASWKPFEDAATMLAGALTFSAGLMLLWLLTLFFLIRAKRFTVLTLFANVVFPAVLVLAALRGQQIQGARYLVWAYFFSTLWNLLELGAADVEYPPVKPLYPLIYSLIAILLVLLPFDCKIMYRVLTTRVGTMKIFEGQHLDVLQGKRGVAMDVGYIGYFSKANICDMVGLVDGRAFAKLSEDQRLIACAASHPDFVFGNPGQLETLSSYMSMTGWRVCSHYDFGNVRTLDTHYLVFPKSTAAVTCKAISGSATYPLPDIFSQQNR